MPTAVPLQAACLSAVSGLRHGFFTREGGVSAGIYAGLNCGYGSDDDRDAVRENRQRATRALGRTETDLATVFQVHGREVATVVEPERWNPAPRADALATRLRGQVLGIMTADCAPILFADPVVGVIAAAHAGWRGARAGVIEATVDRMESLGARRSDIRAALGPAIGPRSYEVDDGFREAFLGDSPDNERYFRDSARTDRFLFNLPGYVLSRLEALGLAAVEHVDQDTYPDAGRLFSYRRATHRGEPDYGRQLSAISQD